MSNNYKTLYEAQKIEHEKTWEKLRSAKRDTRIAQMDYAGAMADNELLVTTFRKHLLQLTQFLDLNYPKEANK